MSRPASQKWEYLVSTVEFDDDQTTQWLNIHGAEGWEVVGTRGHATLAGGSTTFIFKRRLTAATVDPDADVRP